jgi:uncharacterized PurR-regulated membrane protein YhhQ (DUF165 family)
MLANVNRGLVIKLALFHIFIIALANYAVQFTGTFMGYHFTWAMFVFPIVILATDLTVRLSSKENARVIVGVAYIPAILISAWIADWRIGIASGTAYLVGQLLDIFIFQRIRDKSTAWWPAPLISTFIANIVDTYTFFSVAFLHSTNEFMAANWFEIATVDLSFKVVVCITLFLPAYGLLLNALQQKYKQLA